MQEEVYICYSVVLYLVHCGVAVDYDHFTNHWLYILLRFLLMLPSTIAYTQATNKMSAKRNIDSVSRAYMNAKRATLELENCTRGLIRGSSSVPIQGTPQEVHQV